MTVSQARLSWDELAAQHAPKGEGKRSTLAGRFVVPPFSVLDARQDYWRTRKAAWLALGIKSEVGRGKHTEGELGEKNAKKAVTFDIGSEWMMTNETGTSIFDPVLCELIYRWFSAAGGEVLDPFAGGSVRGVVAALTGRRYTGIDLRPEQVAANIDQATEILRSVPDDRWPTWYTGDSANLPTILNPDDRFDLVFTCPPYFDLEVYSDDPKDLSTMTYDRFDDAYRAILAGACARLRPDRFAAVVIGDVRDSSGHYRGLPDLTTRAMAAAGLHLYNEAVLITPAGTMPVRAANQFPKGRKLTKGHQNVLIYVKGDAKRAAEACGTDQDPDAPTPLLGGMM